MKSASYYRDQAREMRDVSKEMTQEEMARLANDYEEMARTAENVGRLRRQHTERRIRPTTGRRPTGMY